MDNKWTSPSPSPLLPWRGRGSLPSNPHLGRRKKKTFVKLFLTEGRRGRVSTEERQFRIQFRETEEEANQSVREKSKESRKGKDATCVQGSHGFAALGKISPARFRLEEAQQCVASSLSSLLSVTMPSVSLSLPTALAGPARTWVCLSCMFWVRTPLMHYFCTARRYQ